MTALNPNAPGWREQRVIPVIVIEDAMNAALLVETLVEAGMPIVEITMRTTSALDAIRRSKSVKGAVVGAGSVRTVDDMKAALDAGADFLVSPGQTDRLLDAGFAAPVPYFPGCANASDMMRAADAGFSAVKFFPAEVNGGVKALQALAGPLPDIHVMPTGGISPANLESYLALKNVIACGGSWMIPSDALTNRDFNRIRELALAARSC